MDSAHYSFKKFKAVVGTVRWNQSEYSYDLEKYVNHEEYDEELYSNDVCLVKTAQPIKIVDTKTHYIVNSVCVPKPGTPLPDKGTVYGWGLLKEDGDPSLDLMKLVVQRYDTTQCNVAYLDYIGNFTEQMMCYGAPGKDSCKVCLPLL